MKALDTTRWVKVKYPRDKPRISRKRLWYDRSEWRQAPEVSSEATNQNIDQALENKRTQTPLGATNYPQFTNAMRRAATAGLKKN